MRIYIWMIVLLIAAPAAVVAQTPIQIGQPVSAAFTPDQPSVEFTFAGAQGDYVEAILDLPERDFPIAMTLIDPGAHTIFYNQGINESFFNGAYINTQLLSDGEYTILVRAYDLTANVDFTLELNASGPDEATGLLTPGGAKKGWIAPGDAEDRFLMSLAEGDVMYVSIDAPHLILDSYLEIQDPDGALVVSNDDFVTTSPVVFFQAETTGVYALSLQPAVDDAAGPYTVHLNRAPRLDPEAPVTAQFTYAGQAIVYEVPLRRNGTYDFSASSTDLPPFLVISDFTMFAIALDYPSAGPEYQARIPGFTPLRNESLALVVAADDGTSLGECQVESTIPDDASDTDVLEPGVPVSVTISPVDDTDLYIIHAEAGRRYSILFRPDWYALDPALRVWNGDELLYENDNAALGFSALLSNIEFPETGDYIVEALASFNQINPNYLTGVGELTFAEGSPFDRYPPGVDETQITLGYADGTALIEAPAEAISDDTYPLTVELRNDRTGHVDTMALERGQPLAMETPASERDVFFIRVADSSDAANAYNSGVVPHPEAIATLIGTPYGVAVDDNNRLYISNSETGGLIQLELSGKMTIVTQGLPTSGGILGPNAVAIGHDGAVYIDNAKENTIRRVKEDGSTETVVSGLAYPSDFIFDEDGAIYVSQFTTDVVEKISPSGGREIVFSGIRNPSGLAFGPDGALYVCNSDLGNSGVYRTGPDGSPEPYAVGFADILQGMAFDEAGYLYAADGTQGVLYRISPDGEVIEYLRGLSGACDVAFGKGEYASTLFVTNMGLDVSGEFSNQVIAVRTPRNGFNVPFTAIQNWSIW
ncbi:MAG: hypothetical protein GC154_11685 [bacterium]|nr:hypothetical protein [bacterium]